MRSASVDLPAVGAGGQSSDALFEAVYARLKAIAGGHPAGRENGSLNTTALVHELYLRVSSCRDLVFSHPAQFFAYAARAMRHLLTDRARNRLRVRAGGDWQRVTFTGIDAKVAIENAEQALALEAALQRLESADERAARVIELHVQLTSLLALKARLQSAGGDVAAASATIAEARSLGVPAARLSKDDALVLNPTDL